MPSRRGARILAEVVGYASNCDAGHLTQPDPSGEGPAVVIKLALAEARVRARAASATSTRTRRRRRSATSPRRARSPPPGSADAAVSSTKSLHGHTLGAAGGIEAVAALMPLVRDRLPPSWNLDDAELEPLVAPREDPACSGGRTP